MDGGKGGFAGEETAVGAGDDKCAELPFGLEGDRGGAVAFVTDLDFGRKAVDEKSDDFVDEFTGKVLEHIADGVY